MTSAAVVTAEQRKIEERLVRDHLALVHYAVSEMATKVPRHVSRDDLMSAGMAGLAQAARSFDPERGINFDRYASTRIRGSLLDELRDRDWASRSVRSKARKLTAASDELTGKLGRVPSTDEVADHLGVEKRAVASISEDVHRAVVLNYDSMIAQGDAEDVMPSDLRSPDLVLVERERRAYLLDAIQALPERLRSVVVGYFFEERSMQDLAEELGVSESRISQMRAEALALLKDGMNSQLEPEAVPHEEKPSPRVARRKAAYYAAIAANSDFRTRLGTEPRVLSEAATRTVA
ncbi:MAG: polymerase sigma factor FliA [Acidimicrobiaceae bacterium]|nr:polymerase sigma factor FliA [Acidimicrobiaceae bacterium]